MEKITGAQAIVRVLAQEGVDVVFGYPGGSVIPLYNALYDAPFKNILAVHEQGAAHAADGYARASGKVGVCIATAGPGATNLVTGLATAYLDSVPVVAITGQVAQNLIGRDAFQEVDIVSVSMAITKYNTMIETVEELVPTLKYAFALAKAGRPGPVLIDVPSSIQNALLDWDEAKLLPIQELPVEKAVLNDLGGMSVLQEVQGVIMQAKRPVLVAGGGVIKANVSDLLAEFIQTTQIPVVSTLMGLGAVDCTYKNYLGLTGMHGHKAANLAISQADVIVVIGSRFSDRVTGNKEIYAKDKRIIQFDIDNSELDKNIGADIGVLGSLQESLPLLLKLVWTRLEIDAWRQEINNWQATTVTAHTSNCLTAQVIMESLNAQFADQDVVYVTDVGQNQMWAAQHLQIRKPRTHLTSGGCGTMGFAVPASVGASFGNKQARIVSISGDGGFKMTGMELHTAVREGLPLISIVINNYCLGMVRQWQHLFFEKRYSSTILGKGFDFVGFAQSCGAVAYQANSPAEFQQALQQAVQSSKAVLIEACIACGDMVEPMVAPGRPLDEFVDVYK